jgi:signal transduction histidine kinase
MDNRIRPAAVAGGLAGLGLALIAGMLLAPLPRLTIHDAPARDALDTTLGIGTLVATYVLLGRYGRRRSPAALALVGGVGILGLTGLFAVVLPRVFAVDPGPELAWAPAAGRLIAPLLLIVSSFASDVPMRRPPRIVVVVALAVGVAALGVALGALVGSAWPDVFMGRPLSARAGSLIDLSGAPVSFLTVQLLGVGLFALAALGLIRRSESTGDALFTWLGLGALGLGLARLTAFLVPPDSVSSISLADLFRVAGVTAFVAAAAHGIRAYQRQLATVAVTDERRRLARELHDGVAQELAFIVSQVQRLIPGDVNGTAHDIGLAAERALMDSRRSIQLLKRSDSPTLTTAIVEQASRVADRAGLTLDIEILDEVEASPEAEYAILRIVQEAISNAAQHSGAGLVSVTVSERDGPLIVRISDDGSGFESNPGGRRRLGFGLVSMAERAESCGGELKVQSQPGRGTVVEVAFG